MISKQIKKRRDGKSSALQALRYCQGNGSLKAKVRDKSHRTRVGNFGVIRNGIYSGMPPNDMNEVIHLAAIEMRANAQLNTRVSIDKHFAHFVVSYNKDRPGEAAMYDTEDSMLAAMGLSENHFISFLHSHNGGWHQHIFVSRIETKWPHRCNSLWHDQINRDKVCREIEIRHGLSRDNGLHQINPEGQIVEIPSTVRQANRELKQAEITAPAKSIESRSGEKSFQTWCLEIRIGDRLKHAKGWQELHSTAAAYACEIKAKGAGFIICSQNSAGGLQLSKVGIKNLIKQFGPFEVAASNVGKLPEQVFKPMPKILDANQHFADWCEKKKKFKYGLNDLKQQQRAELKQVNSAFKGQKKLNEIAILKMNNVVSLSAFKNQNPGNTFRDYMLIEARKGDDTALTLARKYGLAEATSASCLEEDSQFRCTVSMHGALNRSPTRLSFSHSIERNGTIVFNLGQGRLIIDSAVSRQLKLSQEAAISPEAIAAALSYSASRFGRTLSLTGPIEFQRLAVEIAFQNGLNIQFSDPVLQAYKENLVQINRLNHPAIRSNTSTQIEDLFKIQQGEHHDSKDRHSIDSANQNISSNDLASVNEDANRTAASRRSGVHELPDGYLDVEQQNSKLPLQSSLQRNLGWDEKGSNNLRHSGADQSRRSGKGTTREIQRGKGFSQSGIDPRRLTSGRSTKGR